MRHHTDDPGMRAWHVASRVWMKEGDLDKAADVQRAAEQEFAEQHLTRKEAPWLHVSN